VDALTRADAGARRQLEILALADHCGTAGAAVWRELTRRGGQPGHLLGADARRFPADFAALARCGPALRRLETAPQPPAQHTLAEIFDAVRGSRGVDWGCQG
jgi:hypothetical protein